MVVDWSMIGDLVMLSPCVRAISQRYPKAHLAILGQPASINTFKHHPAVAELIPYDRSQGDLNWREFKKPMDLLRKERYDAAFIFHNSFGSALMCWLGRVRQRCGYRHEFRGPLLNRRFVIPEERMHLIEIKANLLRQAGLDVQDLSEEIFIDEKRAKAWIRDKLGPNFGRSRPIVGLAAGATVEYKQWNAKGLHALVNRFPVNSCDFVFIGAPGDRQLFEGVYSYNNTVVDLVGQTTIEELSWVLNSVDLFIGPDSGPVHLAVGRNKPVIPLFGPTDPMLCGPYKYERSRIVRAEQICPGCDSKYGRHIRQCLHTIKPQEVYESAQELLTKYCKRWKHGKI